MIIALSSYIGDITVPIIEIESNTTLAPAQKIKLFRRFFRGRDDVYAIRWENKTGRSGYSPACANEWDRKVCRKPQIKCSECAHQKWLPITDQLIYDHLTGKRFSNRSDPKFIINQTHKVTFCHNYRMAA